MDGNAFRNGRGIAVALQVYFEEDIKNSLVAAEHSLNATKEATGKEADPFAEGYMVGYRAALVTVALAFGLVKVQSGQPVTALLVKTMQ